MDQSRGFFLAAVLFMVVAAAFFGVALLGNISPVFVALGSAFVALGIVYLILARRNSTRS